MVVLALFIVAQALLLLVLGLGLVLARDAAVVVLADAGEDPSVAVVAGSALLAVGLAQLVLVVLLRRGSGLAQSVFGALAVIQVAVGVYSTVALRDFQAPVIVPLATSVGILWLLYGPEATREFFAP